MILKTRVTNLTDKDRTVRWLEVRGIYLAAGESVVVDGAYPSACRNDAGQKELASDVEKGILEVSLVTDMKTEKPAKEESKPASAVNPNPQPPPPMTPKEEEVDDGVEELKADTSGHAFTRHSMEDAIEQQAPIRTLDGQDGTIPHLGDVPMFGEGAIRIETVEIPESAEEKSAAKTPKAKKVVAKKTKSKKPVVKKTNVKKKVKV